VAAEATSKYFKIDSFFLINFGMFLPFAD